MSKKIADIMLAYDKEIKDAVKALPWEVRSSAFPEFEIHGDVICFSNKGDLMTLEQARERLTILLDQLTPSKKED